MQNPNQIVKLVFPKEAFMSWKFVLEMAHKRENAYKKECNISVRFIESLYNRYYHGNFDETK